MCCAVQVRSHALALATFINFAFKLGVSLVLPTADLITLCCLYFAVLSVVQVRSQALALATFVNFASNFGVSLVLPTVQEVFGMQLTYATFAAIGVAAVANIYYNVPETMNKTLEQIEAIWRK